MEWKTNRIGEKAAGNARGGIADAAKTEAISHRVGVDTVPRRAYEKRRADFPEGPALRERNGDHERTEVRAEVCSKREKTDLSNRETCEKNSGPNL